MAPAQQDLISERDQVAAQYDTFRKSIKDLLGQADSTALRFPEAGPVTITAVSRNGAVNGN